MEETELKQQKELIRQAKQHLEGSPPDYHLANFVLRDSPIVKKVKELSDLSWAMHQSPCIAKNEVEFLIELIEKEMMRKIMDFSLVEKNYKIEVYESNFEWHGIRLRYQIRMVLHTVMDYWSVGCIIIYGRHFNYFCYPNREFLTDDNVFRGKNRRKKARELAMKWMSLVNPEDADTVDDFYKQKITGEVVLTKKI